MNAIVPLQTQSMNSLEISELVQSRPDKVKQSIERLAEKGVITLPPMVETSFLNSIGRKQNTTVYTFTGEQGKRDSIIVVAQLCPAVNSGQS
ncbi:DNA-binding protein, partial [Acinetobacter sp. WU_MDCI_Abxc22]|nr:DNA-binding protein [Acinetobacter sp. WU_MDCI_Abxc22]